MTTVGASNYHHLTISSRSGRHKHHLTISSIGKIIHRQHNVQQEFREQPGILIDISLTSLTQLDTDTFVEINTGNTNMKNMKSKLNHIAESPSR